MSDEPQQQSGDPDDGNWTPRDLSAGTGAPAGQPAAPGGKKGNTGRPRRTGWRRAVPTWRAALATLLVIALILIGGFIAGYQLVGIPPANPTATAQSNVYLYKDGTVIARDGDVNRQNVQLAQVPSPSSTPSSPPRTATSTPSAPSTSKPCSGPAGTPSPARADKAVRPSPSSS